MLTIDNTLDGYIKDVEIKGNTIQDINGTGDLSDIRSVGTKVEGQELYEVPVLSTNGLDSSDSNYQEDKLTILSPTPLEKVGDVADRIICKDGVWGVEKNVKRVAIDSNTNITKTANYHTETYDVYNIPLVDILYNNQYAISTIAKGFNSNSFSQLKKLIDEKSVYTYNGVLYVKLEKSKFNNSNEVKTWCLDNLDVRYITTQPTFIPLPHSQQVKLRTFADRTNISFLTEIEPALKAQVPKSLGATVNTHTLQIDSLNKELDRVKKLEESTVSTVTSNKAFTTVAETTQGYFEDVKIEGKTLVNLSNLHKINQGSNFDSAGYATYNCNISYIKSNTEYTILFNSDRNCKRFYVQSHNSKDSYIENVTTSCKSGINILKTISKDEVASFRFRVFEEVNIDNILILEGDHTQNPPSYFEGLKSVGQDTDEIEILSKNKNLFKGKLICADIVDGQGYGSTMHASSEDFIEVKPNTLYALSSPNSLYNALAGLVIAYYDANKKFIKHINMTKNEASPSNAKYCRIRTRKNPQGVIESEELQFIQLQLEEGSSVSPYVPHLSNKKEILYYNSTTQTWEKPVLREWDSIEKHSDGKYYYHKRSGEVVLNGSENWGTFGFEEKLQTVRFYSIYNSICRGEVVCDKIPYNAIINESATVDGFAISGHTQQIRVSIEKSKLSTQDVAGFKAWLQANNVTVVYQLAQEEVYECTNLDLITYQNETNLIVNSGAIQPKATLKVLSNVSNVVKLLQEKVSVLESDINKYMISQNRSQLDATYKSDSVTFKVDYVNSSKNMTNDYSEDLYNLILDNILVGKDNYNYNHMFNLIMDYASWNKITWEQFDILLELIELQNNPVEELPEELN